MPRSKIVRIGLDFDGVVAYNPTRILRAPITEIKRRFLGVKKIKFFVPKHWWQKVMWSLFHESSILPAKGVELLRIMAKDKNYEFHLITARFGFLEPNLWRWLQRHNLVELFKTITINKHGEQPHVYKKRVIGEKDLDYFVEDNLDIVTFLDGSVKAEVAWIYNIVDKQFFPSKKGFPYLEKVLTWISKKESFKKP